MREANETAYPFSTKRFFVETNNTLTQNRWVYILHVGPWILLYLSHPLFRQIKLFPRYAFYVMHTSIPLSLILVLLLHMFVCLGLYGSIAYVTAKVRQHQTPRFMELFVHLVQISAYLLYLLFVVGVFFMWVHALFSRSGASPSSFSQTLSLSYQTLFFIAQLCLMFGLPVSFIEQTGLFSGMMNFWFLSRGKRFLIFLMGLGILGLSSIVYFLIKLMVPPMLSKLAIHVLSTALFTLTSFSFSASMLYLLLKEQYPEVFTSSNELDWKHDYSFEFDTYKEPE